MKNQTQPQTQTTKSGLSLNLKKEKSLKDLVTSEPEIVPQGTKELEQKFENVTKEQAVNLAGIDEIKLPDVLDTLEDFRSAVGQAQLSGKGHVVVSPRIFHFLTSGKETPFLDFGSPSIRVYCSDTMQKVVEIEEMNLDTFHKHRLELKQKKKQQR